VNIKVQVVGSKELLKRMAAIRGLFQSKELRTVAEEAKNRLIRTARDAAPRDSRFLVRSIEGAVEGFGTDNVAIRVGSVARYAPAVEFGTKPHPIVPRGRKSLFWIAYNTPKTRAKLGQAAAVFTFAAKVDHPGTKPQPFLYPALEKVSPRLLQALERLIRQKMEGR
jgi:HK97 gp10 family phage protein